MPLTVAGKLELAQSLRADQLKRFQALHAAPPSKTYTRYISFDATGGVLKLSAHEEVKETPVGDLLAAWRGPVALTPIEDVFNDRLVYAVDSWAKLQTMSMSMLPIMSKFELLRDDHPRVAQATAAFVNNYWAISDVLTAVEARVAGGTSMGKEAAASCDALNTELAAMLTRYDATLRLPSPYAVTVASHHLTGLGITPAHMEFLVDSLSKSGVEAPAFELLYQATVDGTTGKDAMRKCSGKGRVLVIGREDTHGWLFGGYLDCGVDGPYVVTAIDPHAPVEAPQSFLFSLTNPHGTAPVALRRASNTHGALSHSTKSPCAFVHPHGPNRYCLGGPLNWYWSLHTAKSSMLHWTSSEDVQYEDGEEESKLSYAFTHPHLAKVFTGDWHWTASDLVIYRV